LATRTDAARSVQVFKRTFGEKLDPGVPIDEREVFSKVLIDATIPFEWKKKPVMVKLDPEMVKKVNSRREEYKIGT
jgi:4-hydroxy-3-polyprenylbenzoate decarboxylase